MSALGQQETCPPPRARSVGIALYGAAYCTGGKLDDKACHRRTFPHIAFLMCEVRETCPHSGARR